jgi:hypothetical protein
VAWGKIGGSVGILTSEKFFVFYHQKSLQFFRNFSKTPTVPPTFPPNFPIKSHHFWGKNLSFGGKLELNFIRKRL